MKFTANPNFCYDYYIFVYCQKQESEIHKIL